MNTEVVKTEGKGHAMQAYKEPAPQKTLAGDVLIPSVLLMQGMSDFVKERSCQIGDIVRSTTKEKLGDPDQGFDFIPLAEPVPSWILERKIEGRFKFQGKEPRTAANDTLPWDFTATVDGVECGAGAPGAQEWRRVKCLELFAILPQDVEAEAAELEKAERGELPDFSKALTPVLIRFRSTSYKAGKEVSTYFKQVERFQERNPSIHGYCYSLKLSCSMEAKGDNTYYVFNVDRNKATKVSDKLLPTVKKWADLVSHHASSLKVDEVSEGETESVQSEQY